MEFDLTHRRSWLSPDHTRSGYSICITEENEEGRAHVEFTSVNELLFVNTTEKNRLAYLKEQKVADGTICEFIDDSRVRLYLVECKKTVQEKSWVTARSQFRGALQNAFGVCGVLGVTIKSVNLYTAYVSDRLDPHETSNPALLKSRLGKGESPAFQQWRHDLVTVEGVQLDHHKIQLDASGNVAYAIP